MSKQNSPKAALEQAVLRHCQAEQLIPAGSRLLLAISGGVDSMAFLYLMAVLKRRLKVSLQVLQVDHGLRPESATIEREAVLSQADQLAIPATSVSVDTLAYQRQHKCSLEAAARTLRYEALRAKAAANHCCRIGVAHTLDDQLEEILLRLLRGSGAQGLAGMRASHQDIIRPLLPVRKQALMNYLMLVQGRYCEDESNQDRRFTRNRVRLELLPFLRQQFGEGVDSALLKTSRIVTEEDHLLNELTAKAFQQHVQLEETDRGWKATLERTGFVRLAAALQRRLLESLLWQLGSRANFQQIMSLVEAAKSGRTGSQLHLSQGLRVHLLATQLVFTFPARQSA